MEAQGLETLRERLLAAYAAALLVCSILGLGDLTT